jgi:hypothetical protein
MLNSTLLFEIGGPQAAHPRRFKLAVIGRDEHPGPGVT